MNLHQPVSIPASFCEKHYSQEHIMHAMGWSEPEFWSNYIRRMVPPGYSLMRLTGVPLLVWERETLDKWFSNGCPAEIGAIELENRILHNLMAAYEEAGIVFPTFVPCVDQELN